MKAAVDSEQLTVDNEASDAAEHFADAGNMVALERVSPGPVVADGEPCYRVPVSMYERMQAAVDEAGRVPELVDEVQRLGSALDQARELGRVASVERAHFEREAQEQRAHAEQLQAQLNALVVAAQEEEISHGDTGSTGDVGLYGPSREPGKFHRYTAVELFLKEQHGEALRVIHEVVQEREQAVAERDALEQQVEAWQDATGMVGIYSDGSEGDPGDVTPEMLSKHLDELRSKASELDKTLDVLMHAHLDPDVITMSQVGIPSQVSNWITVCQQLRTERDAMQARIDARVRAWHKWKQECGKLWFWAFPGATASQAWSDVCDALDDVFEPIDAQPDATEMADERKGEPREVPSAAAELSLNDAKARMGVPPLPELYTQDASMAAAGEVALDLVLNAVGSEVREAMVKHARFNSAHEGYAVILEELDELKAEVWKRRDARDKERLQDEAVQVAAMAVRFVLDVI